MTFPIGYLEACQARLGWSATLRQTQQEYTICKEGEGVQLVVDSTIFFCSVYNLNDQNSSTHVRSRACWCRSVVEGGGHESLGQIKQLSGWKESTLEIVSQRFILPSWTNIITKNIKIWIETLALTSFGKNKRYLKPNWIFEWWKVSTFLINTLLKW